MRDSRRRPFYSEYAWAFDLLIDRPVRKECATIVAWLVERGVLPGANLLDAGCGTGRYSAELGRRGYVVDGIDESPELIDQAKRSTGGGARSVSFLVGDITELPRARYDAILCRGVLNDFVDDRSRQAVFAAFAQSLRPAGVLILDVRDWEATATRKLREPLFKKSVATDRGTLTFTSVTELDPANRQLIISERHTLSDEGHEQVRDYVFAMRCWTRDEVNVSLSVSGLSTVACFGAYDAAVAAGTTDRLIAVAQRSKLELT
jgi:SAM-dependent methyltransferase